MSDVVHIDPPPESQRLWAKALKLAQSFGAEERWVLVGGLMVQLHAFERGRDSRLTRDIDFLGDSRRRPPMTERITEILVDHGGEMVLPSVSDENLGYKFDVGGETVEVLGSEGTRADPKTLGKYTTFQVPGGTQALARAQVVQVSLPDGDVVAVRRPSLLGAILLKARVVAKQRDKFEADRQDMILLLSFVDDPRGLAESEKLRKSEKKWLRDVGSLLDFGDAELAEAFTRREVDLAEQAFRLLVT